MKIFHFLVFCAGLVLPIQIAFNNKLTSYSGPPLISSFISFFVGSVVLFLIGIVNFNNVVRSIHQVGHAPPYAWLGGVVGSFYVVTTLTVSPKIGMIMSVGLVIGGQLLMSLLIDHFGWLGVEIKPLSWSKGAGILLVLFGILLLKK